LPIFYGKKVFVISLFLSTIQQNKQVNKQIREYFLWKKSSLIRKFVQTLTYQPTKQSNKQTRESTNSADLCVRLVTRLWKITETSMHQGLKKEKGGYGALINSTA
jgi:CDP-glycerol glycerophosphotransferase (TagB/SpsB family)